MNVERGLRRLLVLATVVLVLAVVALRITLSSPSVSCAYMVILADGSLGRIIAPRGTTSERVQAEARRLHPETKNPVVLTPLDPKKGEQIPPPPDEPAIPESCAASEGAFARLVRYTREAAVGIAVALVIAAVLWAAFFALRWVARGFKSEGTP
jgi:hypothetical protein